MTPELAKRVAEGLKAADISFISYLPESRLSNMLPHLEAEDSITLVRTTHEGSAVNIASGAAMVGENAAVYMECTGVLASIYNLESTPIYAGIPILLLVSYCGGIGDQHNSATFSGYGRRTEPLLQALDIPYQVLEDGHRLETRIKDMARAAQSAKYPTCLLFTGDFTL